MFNFFNTAKAVSVAVAAASQKLSSTEVVLVDVRSRGEYDFGHAKGAQNIPLDMIQGHLGKLQQYSEVYVICQSGGRSAMATKILAGVGVNAINVSGGTSAWRSHGLPME